MNEVFILFLGVLLAWMAGWLFRFWNLSQENTRRRAARLILKRHGLTAHRYLATIGAEDAELRSALDTFALTGYIITDSEGRMVGKLIPTTSPLPQIVEND